MGRRTRGILLIILGLAMTLSAAMIYARFEQQAAAAAVNAETLLQEVKVQLQQQQLTPVVVEAPKGQMPQISVEGLGVTAVLQVEKLGLELPVMAAWSEENLRHGICRYAGSVETGDLVLMGHNYVGYLADLDQLRQGDTLVLTDVTGTSQTYLVAETATIVPTAVEAVTETGYPLTVFTCTPGGNARYAVYFTEQ